MNDYVKALIVFVQSRRVGRILPAIGVVFLVQLFGATPLVKLPFGDASARLSPVMAALWATLIGSLVIRRSPQLEWFKSERLRLLRLVWSVLLTIGIALITEILSQLRGSDPFGVQIRSTLLFVGIAFLSAVVLAPRYLWLPLLGTAAVLFSLGLGRYDARPYPWALPYRPATELATWIVPVLLAIAGIAAYTIHDARHSKGVDG